MSCFTFSFCFPPWVVVLRLSAIVDIPEYSALSEAIVTLTGEGIGKIVNNRLSE